MSPKTPIWIRRIGELLIGLFVAYVFIWRGIEGVVTKHFVGGVRISSTVTAEGREAVHHGIEFIVFGVVIIAGIILWERWLSNEP